MIVLADGTKISILYVCVTQRHHHHSQQRRGVVQASGRQQIKAVHLAATERQIYNQALLEPNTEKKELCVCCISLRLLPRIIQTR